MKLETIRNLLTSTQGRVFTATFIKKDGQERVMNCRLGVTKGTKGGRNPVADKPQYLSVFDMQRKSYKTLNMSTLKTVKIDGCTLYLKGA